MVASVLTCLSFIFFLPYFSNSCTPSLPCNPSVEIKPPFYLQSDITIDYNCHGYLPIECYNKTPFLLWLPNKPLPLESISYDNNTITVQNPDLSSSLKKSGCRNVNFNFSSPINLYRGMYGSLNSSLSSVRCDPPDHIQSLPKIFGKDYNLSYSPSLGEDDKPKQNCLRPENSVDPSFKSIFSFKNDSSRLTLLSASYSDDIVARPGCFANWTEVFDPEDGKENHLRTRIIIGCVVGLAFVLALCGLLLLICKRKKLSLISSSSKLQVQREVSDQYFPDPEMVGSEYNQIFSYEELWEATEGFSKSKELGDGGFGIVFKGILKDGRTVAVKRLYKNSYKSTEQFTNEVKNLSGLHHPNLVTLYGSCIACSRQELLLVYEFVPNGTVADHLHRPRSSKNALTWPVRLSIAIEAANALAYLHAVEPPIIHRNVKTNNILLDDDFHVKVGDFGFSRFLTVPQGTTGYVDPMYHQCYHLTDKSDVYSFGVVLMEFISSKQAVDLSRGKNDVNLANLALNKIQRCQLDELVDPALGFRSNWEVRCMVSLVAELAYQCLQPDREMRPSIKEVLETLRVIGKGDYNGDKLVKEKYDKGRNLSVEV